MTQTRQETFEFMGGPLDGEVRAVNDLGPIVGLDYYIVRPTRWADFWGHESTPSTVMPLTRGVYRLKPHSNYACYAFFWHGWEE